MMLIILLVGTVEIRDTMDSGLPVPWRSRGLEVTVGRDQNGVDRRKTQEGTSGRNHLIQKLALGNQGSSQTQVRAA